MLNPVREITELSHKLATAKDIITPIENIPLDEINSDHINYERVDPLLNLKLFKNKF